MKLKLHRMPPEARRMAHRAYLDDHASAYQIAAMLQEAGFPISKSSVDRYLHRIGGQLEQIHLEAKTEALANRIAELVVEKLLIAGATNAIDGRGMMPNGGAR